jgi:hypothetical protein
MALSDITRLLVIAALVAYILYMSTHFEREYSMTLAYLYQYPWWRLLLAFAFVAALAWCPWVGILFGAVLFFYLSDMGLLMQPIPDL